MRPMIFCNQGGLMIKEEFYFDSRDGENRIHAVRYTPDDGFPFISSNVVVDNADGRRFQCTKSFDSCRRTPGNHSNVEFAM